MVAQARRMTPLHLLLIGALIALVGLIVPQVAAQEGGDIQYNDPVIVTLNSGESLTRTFSVLPGDTVDVKLSRLAAFTYTAVLIDPSQATTPLVPDTDGNADLLIENASGVTDCEAHAIIVRNNGSSCCVMFDGMDSQTHQALRSLVGDWQLLPDSSGPSQMAAL